MIEQSSSRTRFSLSSPVARWLAVVAWMTLIFAFSAQQRLPGLAEPLADVLLKKTAHFLEYGALALLLWRAWAWRARALAWAWLVAVLYASTDEWHQSFVPGRHPRAWDVLIDGAGAAVLLLLAWAIMRRSRRAALKPNA